MNESTKNNISPELGVILYVVHLVMCRNAFPLNLWSYIFSVMTELSHNIGFLELQLHGNTKFSFTSLVQHIPTIIYIHSHSEKPNLPQGGKNHDWWEQIGWLLGWAGTPHGRCHGCGHRWPWSVHRLGRVSQRKQQEISPAKERELDNFLIRGILTGEDSQPPPLPLRSLTFTNNGTNSWFTGF